MLSKETEARIADIVTTHNFKSADEAVQSALDIMDKLVEEEREIRRKIDEGIAQLNAGEGIPAAEVFAELRERNVALRNTLVE